MRGLTSAGCLLQTEEAKHPLVAVVEVTVQLGEKDYKLFETVFKRDLFFISMIQLNAWLCFWICSLLNTIKHCLLKQNPATLDSFILYKENKPFSGQHIGGGEKKNVYGVFSKQVIPE